MLLCYAFFFFKQKTAYDMRISDWSSDVCSSDLDPVERVDRIAREWRIGVEIAHPVEKLHRAEPADHRRIVARVEAIGFAGDARRIAQRLLHIARAAIVEQRVVHHADRLRGFDARGVGLGARQTGGEGKSVSVRVKPG